MLFRTSCEESDMKSKPTLLLTLDAFGTLFIPREPIAKQYGDLARRHGLTGFSNEDVDSSFRKGELAYAFHLP